MRTVKLVVTTTATHVVEVRVRDDASDQDAVREVEASDEQQIVEMTEYLLEQEDSDLDIAAALLQ